LIREDAAENEHEVLGDIAVEKKRKP